MSRKSAEAIAVTPVALVPNRRAEPPEELNPQEAKEWRKIVGSMPIHWFTVEMYPILISLCQTICTLDEVTKEVKKTKVNAKEFAALAKTQMLYMDMVMKLSTKLRLTPQSRFTENDARKATKEAVANRSKTPWGGQDAKA